jgi:hypothetical protein
MPLYQPVSTTVSYNKGFGKFQERSAQKPTKHHFPLTDQSARLSSETHSLGVVQTWLRSGAQKLGAASDGVMFLEVTKVGKDGETVLVNISRKLRVSLIRMLLCICYIVTFRISEGIETSVNEQHRNDPFTSNFEIKLQSKNHPVT